MLSLDEHGADRLTVLDIGRIAGRPSHHHDLQHFFHILFQQLKTAGALKFEVGGVEIALAEEDLLIETAQKDGYVSEADNSVTVVLDTNLTEELIEEGFVYEVIFSSFLCFLHANGNFLSVDIPFPGHCQRFIRHDGIRQHLAGNSLDILLHDLLYRYSFKPQLKTVGPKYGKQLGGIREYLSAVDGTKAMEELKSAGALKFEVGGVEIALAEEDLLIAASLRMV